jgi:cell fate (sporulation/competence/biofilm development) regulator YlbF (YheA/YmcA/DUF963 family)
MEVGVEEQAILSKAKRLASVLGASQPFRNCESVLQEFQNDASAGHLIAEFRRIQQEASTHQQLWDAPDTNLYAQLRALQERIEAHPVLRKLQQSESALLELLLGCVLRLGNLCEVDFVEACTGRSLAGCGTPQPPTDATASLSFYSEVSSAAEELAQGIRQSDAFRKYVQAKDSFQRDANVNRLREEMRNAQRDYLQAQNEGRVTLEMIEHVRAIQNQLREHPAIHRFSEARRDFYQLFQTVNRTVSEVLGMDVAQTLAPAQGCCG